MKVKDERVVKHEVYGYHELNNGRTYECIETGTVYDGQLLYARRYDHLYGVWLTLDGVLSALTTNFEKLRFREVEVELVVKDNK